MAIAAQNSCYHVLINLMGKLVHSDLVRQIEYLKVENTILRSRCQKRITTTPGEKRKLLKFGLPLGGTIKKIISIVNYSTFRRWATDGITIKGKNKDSRGRKRKTPTEIIELILKMAAKNTGWGYGRILGELKKLDIISLSRNTIKNIMIANGFDPAPKRYEDSWDAFIKRHFETLWACDFFTKTIWTVLGPKLFHILFFINIKTREVHIAGMTQNPKKEWVVNAAKTISFLFEDAENAVLIRDGDGKFTKEFDEVFKNMNTTIQRIPYRSPNLNPYAEGWVGTIKREYLNHFIVLGARHLDYLVEEFVNYYNTERPHSGLEYNTISKRERLGGLIVGY